MGKAPVKNGSRTGAGSRGWGKKTVTARMRAILFNGCIEAVADCRLWKQAFSGSLIKKLPEKARLRG